jgi:hypothetical protein
MHRCVEPVLPIAQMQLRSIPTRRIGSYASGKFAEPGQTDVLNQSATTGPSRMMFYASLRRTSPGDRSDVTPVDSHLTNRELPGQTDGLDHSAMTGPSRMMFYASLRRPGPGDRSDEAAVNSYLANRELHIREVCHTQTRQQVRLVRVRPD